MKSHTVHLSWVIVAALLLIVIATVAAHVLR